MDDIERKALGELRFDWAPTKQDVWVDPEVHIDGLNQRALDAVMTAFGEAEASPEVSPLGVAIVGQAGAGKTHLLGQVRRRVQQDDGYFFLVSLSSRDFWPDVSFALLDGLRHRWQGGELDQSAIVLRRLADRLSLSDMARAQLVGEASPTRAGLSEIVTALCQVDRLVGFHCRHTLRALILVGSADVELQEIGESYLQSESETVPGERAALGLNPDAKPAREVAEELSQLVGLTGQSVLAVDQIDTLISQSDRPTDVTKSGPADPSRDLLLDTISTGLLDLREATRRTVTVVACQAHVWQGILARALGPVAARFRPEEPLYEIPSTEVGQELITELFRHRFSGIGFDPPYPTWPVLQKAFATANLFTARGLIQRIDRHITKCLKDDTVRELATLDDSSASTPPPDTQPNASASDDHFAALDRQLASLREVVDLEGALDPATEDRWMPGLLTAGLCGFVMEQGSDRDRYLLEPDAGGNPAIHAKLKLNPDAPDQIQWSFRSIAASNAIAVINRIGRLIITGGLDPDSTRQKAYLLRTGKWSKGKKTTEKIQEFERSGGVVIRDLQQDDLRTFAALERMGVTLPESKQQPGFREWLLSRRPAGKTALFTRVFGPPPSAPEPGSPTPPPEQPSNAVIWPGVDPDTASPQAEIPPAESQDVLSLGSYMDTGGELLVPLESLRKHTTIFAGSGSGKTVLIRRIVEECALRGVSAIVLDPNNDLSRLGMAWPEPPTAWASGDSDRAAEYLDHTDVVIWTPGYETGRPLSFQPLPDLTAVADNRDEVRIAIDTTVAALAPRAKVDGSTAKAEQARSVLRRALRHFTERDGKGLPDFLRLLADLPDGVSQLSKAYKMAQDMADTLHAAMDNDSLFGGSGVPVDPAVLFTPAAGKRARISVISFIGLKDDQQQQNFVNQLQMALFAWIKQHPAGDRPLGGLFVMDEAQNYAPSGSMTACTHSTLALVAQARKYGLGLIFATQAPKNLHNRIPGNSSSQFLGFLNSPIQIAAAKEIASAKSSAVLDISRLKAGQFYVGTEGVGFRKVRTPMCLSYHPPSAPTQEEVLAVVNEGR